MPFRTMRLAPGVNVEASPTLNQVNFAQSNLIRFYGGLIQKLGGWVRMATTPLIGICRGMHGWSDLSGNAYIACGTEQRVQVLTGGILEDITPITQTDNPAVAFSTTASSATVMITDSVYQPNVGDWINLTTQVAVGGLVLFGFYQVTGLVGSTQFMITAASPAASPVTNGGVVPQFTTSSGLSTVKVTLPAHGLSSGQSIAFAVATTVGGITVAATTYSVTVLDANDFDITVSGTATGNTAAFMNSGNAQIEYLLPTGYAVNTSLTGYGSGDYGAGDYGEAGSGTVTAYLRQWSMDHWGASLIASPTGGAIYYWTPPSIPPVLQVVSDTAPTINNSMFVIPQARIIVALGASTAMSTNPLLVQWCDVDDFTDWTPTVTNQAGSYQLSSGTALLGGIAVGLGALLWTDTDVWLMSYVGFPLVFSFTQLAGSCGLIAMRAGGDAAGSVMWLSTRGFYAYQTGAGVDSVECPVWDFIFDNIDPLQLNQTHCAVNSLFNEFAWYFPILTTSPIYNTNAPLGYVKYNFVENVWDYGQSAQLQRTAWVEKNPASNPTGTDLAGLIQQHEVSNDADGAGMQWSWQTGYFSLMNGEEFSFVDLIIPDFVLNWTSGFNPPVINVSLLGTDYPIGLPDGAGVGEPLVDGPYTITTTQPGATLMVPCRLRARQIALQASGSDVGSFNRIGAIRVRYAPDGRN